MLLKSDLPRSKCKTVLHRVVKPSAATCVSKSSWRGRGLPIQCSLQSLLTTQGEHSALLEACTTSNTNWTLPDRNETNALTWKCCYRTLPKGYCLQCVSGSRENSPPCQSGREATEDSAATTQPRPAAARGWSSQGPCGPRAARAARLLPSHAAAPSSAQNAKSTKAARMSTAKADRVAGHPVHRHALDLLRAAGPSGAHGPDGRPQGRRLANTLYSPVQQYSDRTGGLDDKFRTQTARGIRGEEVCRGVRLHSFAWLRSVPYGRGRRCQIWNWISFARVYRAKSRGRVFLEPTGV